MKTARIIKKSQLPVVTIDSSLDELQRKSVFPEKLAKANKMLETAKLPNYKLSS